MELLTSSTIGKEEQGNKVTLRIDVQEEVYSFSYRCAPGQWTLLKDSVDAKFLSTRAAGGFVGCMVAMYATSQGKASTSLAEYDWFEYSGDDRVFK